VTLIEVFQGSNDLSRVEKIQLIQMVAQQLAADELDLIKPGQSYPGWAPFNECAAAAKRSEALANEKTRS
jgi:hypothetical protein